MSVRALDDQQEGPRKRLSVEQAQLKMLTAVERRKASGKAKRRSEVERQLSARMLLSAASPPLPLQILSAEYANKCWDKESGEPLRGSLMSMLPRDVVFHCIAPLIRPQPQRGLAPDFANRKVMNPSVTLPLKKAPFMQSCAHTSFVQDAQNNYRFLTGHLRLCVVPSDLTDEADQKPMQSLTMTDPTVMMSYSPRGDLITGKLSHMHVRYAMIVGAQCDISVLVHEVDSPLLTCLLFDEHYTLKTRTVYAELRTKSQLYGADCQQQHCVLSMPEPSLPVTSSAPGALGFLRVLHRDGTDTVWNMEEVGGSLTRQVYHLKDTCSHPERAVQKCMQRVQEIAFSSDGSLLMLSSSEGYWEHSTERFKWSVSSFQLVERADGQRVLSRQWFRQLPIKYKYTWFDCMLVDSLDRVVLARGDMVMLLSADCTTLLYKVALRRPHCQQWSQTPLGLDRFGRYVMYRKDRKKGNPVAAENHLLVY